MPRHGPIHRSNPVNRAHPLNRGRQAWWMGVPGLSGGNRLADLFGLNHGTVTNSVAWTPAPQRGDEVQEILLNGSTGYVDCGNASALNPTSAFAYCIRYRPKTSVAGAWLITRDDNALGRSYSVGPASVQIQGGVALSYTASADSANLDQHLIVTGSSASNTIACYWNGQPNGSATWSAPGAATGSTNLGRRSYSGAEGYSNLWVREASVYNRLLTAAEALALYQDALAGYPETLNRVRTFLPAVASASANFFLYQQTEG